MRYRAWMALVGVLALWGAASVRAAEDPLAKEPHVITVKMTGFEPATLEVQRGEVVRWQWESGAFTVASGEDPDDDNPDAFPQFTINGDNPSHDVTFTTVGEFPFYGQGTQMVHGKVIVKEITPVNPATWGKIKRLFEN